VKAHQGPRGYKRSCVAHTSPRGREEAPAAHGHLGIRVRVGTSCSGVANCVTRAASTGVKSEVRSLKLRFGAGASLHSAPRLTFHQCADAFLQRQRPEFSLGASLKQRRVPFAYFALRTSVCVAVKRQRLARHAFRALHGTGLQLLPEATLHYILQHRARLKPPPEWPCVVLDTVPDS